MQIKWLLRLLRRTPRKPRTPLPPKPYLDTASPGRHMVDPRLMDTTAMQHLDPEKPHWHDPRFCARATTPFLDLFGYNQDWSWSLFKFSTIIVLLVLYWEMRNMSFSDNSMPAVLESPNIAPVPSYARDDEAIERELREAGLVYVGVKNLDNLNLALRSPVPHAQKK